MSSTRITAADVLAAWETDLASGTPPPRFPVAEPSCGLSRLDLAPGRVCLVGGEPGIGKTALVMQVACEAVSRTPGLRAVVCNVDMTPRDLIERQVARLAGVPLDDVRDRRVRPEDQGRLDVGKAAVRAIADRITFVDPPYSLDHLADSIKREKAGLVVVDYVQSVTPPKRGPTKKDEVEAVMTAARGYAAAGAAVLLVSAVGRQRDAYGKAGYGGLTLASFRESSDLEYGCDDAYLLLRAKPKEPTLLTLQHVKCRHRGAADFRLRFDGPLQRFASVAAPAAEESKPVKPKSTKAKSAASAAEGGGQWLP